MDEQNLRLSKYLANLDVCSRREADEYIKQGFIKINGIVATLGDKVSLTDVIEIDDKIKQIQNNKYSIILNKPLGIVSTQPEKNYKDAKSFIIRSNYVGRKQIPKNFNTKKLSCAGRLDIDSTGLLLLTQDGILVKKIIGNTSDIEKEYIVKVDGIINNNKIKLLNYGLSLDGEKLLRAKVRQVNNNVLNFILKQGKKRQIRRMCMQLDLQVLSLKRIRIGTVKLYDLPIGKWRFIDKKELDFK